MCADLLTMLIKFDGQDWLRIFTFKFTLILYILVTIEVGVDIQGVH